MRDFPLSVILTWPTPNYKNPKTRGSALLATNIILIILVTLAVFARIWTRVAIKKYYGLDDTMIILAWISTVGMTTVVLLANRKYGWNRHVWDVEFGMIQQANIIAFTAKQMYLCASGFTRISLLCLYYRLVHDTRLRWYRWTLHASLAFVIGYWISMMFLGVFLCYPVQVYWLFPATVKGSCLDEGSTTLIAGILSCVADLLCTCLPIPLIMRLQMPRRQRIGVSILLSLGFIVTIAGIIRTYFIWKSLINTWDETWFTYPLWIAAAVEIDIGVLCACAPALKPILWNPFARHAQSLSARLTGRSPKPTSRDQNTSVETEKAPFRYSTRRLTRDGKDGEIELTALERGLNADKSSSRTPSELDAMSPSWDSPAGRSTAKPTRLEIHRETSFVTRSASVNSFLPEPPVNQGHQRVKSRPLIPPNYGVDRFREEPS